MQEFVVRKRKYITLPDRYKKQLREEFGVTSESVRLALDFKTDGQRPEAIRARALEMGGFVSTRAV